MPDVAAIPFESFPQLTGVCMALPRNNPLPVWSISLGCPKNRVDTEKCLGSLGVPITLVDEIPKARLLFINTCAFIEPAVRESLHTIFDVIESVKECRRKPLLVVAGCLVGRYGRPTFHSEIAEVDLWLDVKDRNNWPAEIQKVLFGNVRSSPGRYSSSGASYAWLKIADGCRNACSFCTIPAIRGKLVSSSMDELVQEASVLLKNGVKELDLVGQDVTSYGQDADVRLIDLLAKLAELPDLFWLRLLYLYPSGITDDLLHAMRDIGAPLLPYFDIPFQHVDAEILRLMGRPFSVDPLRLIERILAILPDAVFRTTFIVGFPGEQDEHFSRLLKFVEQGYFQHVGVFCYQAEEGTKAAQFPNQVSESVANARRDALMSAQKEISRKKLLARVGSTLPVLVDATHPEWPTLYTGRVWFQAPEIDGMTYISGEHIAVGTVTMGEIVESIDYDLTALQVADS